MNTLLHEYRCTMLDAPFEVVLVDAVVREGDAVTIPRLAEMIATVATIRLRQERRLTNDDMLYLRKSAGMHSSEISSATGLTPDEYQTFERGERSMPAQVEKIVRIALDQKVRKDLAPALASSDAAVAYLAWILNEWRAKPTLAGKNQDIRLTIGEDGWRSLG